MKTIKQKVKFNASPNEVYDALMDSEKHSAFTGGEAKISREVGGKFSVYDGYAEGENLELIEGEKIVQTWRAESWPRDHYSKVTFELKKVSEGTELNFVQENVPEDAYEEIKQGWIDFYWDTMREFLENKS